MEKCLIFFLFFLNFICLIHRTTSNTDDDPVMAMLQELGYQKRPCRLAEWGVAFEKLLKKFNAENEKVRQLSVLNVVRRHFEILALKHDPLFYAAEDSSATIPVVTIRPDDIPEVEIPLQFHGKREKDYKAAYLKWYRIIMNSNDHLLLTLCEVAKEKKFTKMDVIRNLAILWYYLHDDIRSLMDTAVSLAPHWRSGDEVAQAFRFYEEDDAHLKFIGILFDVTKFQSDEGIRA